MRIPLSYKDFVKKCNRLTFDENNRPVHTKQFKKYYIRYAIELLEDYNLDFFRCNNPRCRIDNWFGAEMLYHGELHHKNGITHDSRFINLNNFCKNCHGLTKGYKNRSIDTEMIMEIKYGKEIFI